MSNIIEDPDYDGFDGRYVDDTVITPPPEYNYTLLAKYMRENNKNFVELSKEEIEMFKL